uniref:(northern house mosquito) hypothetical protein n=1 Tax=Culex pipiens TaxID=7175 RepID=A0A8D8AQV2_CULPI
MITRTSSRRFRGRTMPTFRKLTRRTRMRPPWSVTSWKRLATILVTVKMKDWWSLLNCRAWPRKRFRLQVSKSRWKLPKLPRCSRKSSLLREERISSSPNRRHAFENKSPGQFPVRGLT